MKKVADKSDGGNRWESDWTKREVKILAQRCLLSKAELLYSKRFDTDVTPAMI